MTRTEAIETIRRTRRFMDNPANSDYVVRALVNAQLRNLERQLATPEPVPIASVIDRVIERWSKVP